MVADSPKPNLPLTMKAWAVDMPQLSKTSRPQRDQWPATSEQEGGSWNLGNGEGRSQAGGESCWLLNISMLVFASNQWNLSFFFIYSHPNIFSLSVSPVNVGQALSSSADAAPQKKWVARNRRLQSATVPTTRLQLCIFTLSFLQLEPVAVKQCLMWVGSFGRRSAESKGRCLCFKMQLEVWVLTKRPW